MHPDHSLHAVLTGDIVNSTGLGPEPEELLRQSLQRELAPNPVEFYRGDSWQAYLGKPDGALRLALLSRMLAINQPPEAGEPGVADMRVSIGLGPVVQPVVAPGTAKGEAFLLSGRGLDSIQRTEKRLTIISGHAIADIGFQAMANHLDSICRGMTAKQAGAISWLLRGATQQEVTGQLGKSKSTVSQLVAAGNWAQIEEILQQFESLVKQLL